MHLAVWLSVIAAVAPRPSLEQQTRTELAELVAVDTSHGHETEALKPIAEKLRAAGLPVELLESAPGRGNLVARYRGNGTKRPMLLIAHVDVVPVEGQPWTVPPFKLTEKDGWLYGRGVNDQKAMAAAMVALALELAREKPVLSRDVIFAWTAGEETGGFAGAQWLAQKHKSLIDADFALNEGGMLRLSDDLARITEVGIGTAEKTFQSYRLVVRGKGGHSSMPPTDSDPVVTLAQALVKVGAVRFPMHLLPAAKSWLPGIIEGAKPPVADALKRSLASGSVSASDVKIIETDKLANAMLRTTCVTTQLQAAPQDNELPTTAEAVVNCRIMPDEKREDVEATLRKAIGDASVELAPTNDFGYGPYSPDTGVVPSAITKVAHQLWPQAQVHVSFAAGATDSRHLRAVGIPSYGIAVSPSSRAEGMSGHVAHGPDERRPAKWLAAGAEYLRALTLELAR